MLLLHYSVIYLFPCYVICSRRFSATAMDNPKGQESPSVLDEEAFALPSKLLQEFTSMSTIDKAWLFKPDTHTGGNGNAKSLSSFLILLYFNLVSCYLLMMMEIRYFQLLLRECFAWVNRTFWPTREGSSFCRLQFPNKVTVVPWNLSGLHSLLRWLESLWWSLLHLHPNF